MSTVISHNCIFVCINISTIKITPLKASQLSFFSPQNSVSSHQSVLPHLRLIFYFFELNIFKYSAQQLMLSSLSPTLRLFDQLLSSLSLPACSQYFVFVKSVTDGCVLSRNCIITFRTSPFTKKPRINMIIHTRPAGFGPVSTSVICCGICGI